MSTTVTKTINLRNEDWIRAQNVLNELVEFVHTSFEYDHNKFAAGPPLQITITVIEGTK